jgi:hypothetical protein
MTLPKIIGLWSPAPGSGKTTVAQLLADHTIVSFAEPLKRMATELLICAGYREDEAQRLLYRDKHESLTRLSGWPTGRALLQRLGSEFGRDQIHPLLWVNLWIFRATECEHVVADDVRFGEEMDAIRDLGGEVWSVVRPGFYDKTGHKSENALAGRTFDRVIINDGTLEDLEAKVLR